ncbi:Rieske 2Fe-2S domain-containing protein [Zhongshania borealis]|uniref:Rieske 2Fe-2S domain-containing protein n=1 Tax=Zhongshania borealis TaxID=889488 RepID=A0ABP7X1Q5_9GAMM
MIKEQIAPIKIIAAPIEDRYARGWHYFGLPAEITNQPKPIVGFGTRLVAYRGDDGEVYVLDGYCPHMGAELSRGCVEGNSIRCPFHDWRWGADGFCDDIPYAKRIPPKARIKSWSVLEVNGQLFIWHDPEDSQPSDDITIPNLEVCDADEWSEWVVRRTNISTNCRELIDNVSDKAHFGSIHHSAAAEFTNVFEGHIATQIMRGINDERSEFDASAEMISVATYYGPAVMYVDMKQTIQGQHVESIWMNAHMPIDTDSFELFFGVKIKKIAGMSEAEGKAFLEAYVDASQRAFDEDVAIWENKTRVDNPVLCDGDGPINMLRQWYQQFYVNKADVPTKWQSRREIKV